VKKVLSVVGIALSLFLGFWAFVYQGYQEHAGSRPLHTWPYGAVLYGLAVVLIVGLVRRTRPNLSWGDLVVLAVLLTLVAILAALGSLDAGGHSFEF
jgi:hypothetical protein